MSFALKNFKEKVYENCKGSIPKGELWLGKELFGENNLTDTPENHILYAEKSGHSIVSLSVSDFPDREPDSGYTYFTPAEIKEAAKVSSLPVTAVLDGPFQQMVGRIGMMEVLSRWIQDKEEISRDYSEISERTLELITELADSDISAIVIADDFSTDSGPMVSPSDIDDLFTPFYSEAVKNAQKFDKPLFLHCCGSLSILLPVIEKWQIDGFFAVQSTINDLESVYEKCDRSILIMGGIEPDLLETDSGDALKRLGKICSVIGKSGNLIIGTSTGLYKSRYANSIKKIYEYADKFLQE